MTTPDVKFLDPQPDPPNFGSALSLSATKPLSTNQLDSDRISVLFNSVSDIDVPPLLDQPEPASSSGDKETSNSGPKKLFNWRVALRKEALLLGLGICVYSSGAAVVFQCLPPLGKEAGVSKETVALTLAIGGGLEIPCRILSGILADRKILPAIAQMSLYMGIAGLAAVLCAIISGLPGILIMVVAMSACGTTVYSLLPIVSGQLLGQENVVTALGLFRTYQSVATALSVFSAGMLYEAFGQWEYVFYYMGAVMLGGAAINGSIAIYSYFSHRTQQSPDTQSH